MDLKVAAIQSTQNFKQNSTTSREGSKKKPPTSFADILKNVMKR
ncbi:hypothetical protein [Sporomusa aerivorans]